MMEAVHAPPFESFYLEHRDAVLAFLRRRLGPQSAEDAFQETFLRALRGYGNLRHARELAPGCSRSPRASPPTSIGAGGPVPNRAASRR